MNSRTKMKTKSKILLGFLVMLPTLLYLLVLGYIRRDSAVFNFRSQLRYQSWEIENEYRDEYLRLISTYTRDTLLYSIKPLRTKYWFTEEQIEKYKLYMVDNYCN